MGMQMRTNTYGKNEIATGMNTIMSSNVLYCVLYIDRFSNRVLETVYQERANAESYRNRSSHRLYIEPVAVPGYEGQNTLWCSNEWGPGDVLSFIELHTDYEDAHRKSYADGRPSPVKVADSPR